MKPAKTWICPGCGYVERIIFDEESSLHCIETHHEKNCSLYEGYLKGHAEGKRVGFQEAINLLKNEGFLEDFEIDNIEAKNCVRGLEAMKNG